MADNARLATAHFPEAYAPFAGVTTSLDDATRWTDAEGVVLPSFLHSSAFSAPVAPVIALNVGARRARLWDGQYWGVILVFPRVKDLGPVVAQTNFQVEVWNADEIPHNATGYTIVGAGGVTLSGGVALPAYWAPFASVFYTANIDSTGDPLIDALITFLFPGFTGADCHVTGFRIQILPLSPDWPSAFTEKLGFATSVITSRDGTEQRALLRVVPVREISYTGFSGDPVVSETIAIKLFLGGNGLYAIPYWPDAVKLGANVTPGDSTLTVDTTTRIFEAGMLALVYRDESYWEAYTIASVSAGSLTLENTATLAFTANRDLVIPLLVARPKDTPAIRYPAPGKAEFTGTYVTEPT